MNKWIELWVCDDCMLIRETDCVDDLSERREAEIRACLHALEESGSRIANDGGEWGEQLECRECGFIHQKDKFDSFEQDSEEGLYVAHFCPQCHSDDVQIREGGEDDFSWNDCDCCGSSLGGSRHRYALFPKE